MVFPEKLNFFKYYRKRKGLLVSTALIVHSMYELPSSAPWLKNNYLNRDLPVDLQQRSQQLTTIYMSPREVFFGYALLNYVQNLTSKDFDHVCDEKHGRSSYKNVEIFKLISMIVQIVAFVIDD